MYTRSSICPRMNAINSVQVNEAVDIYEIVEIDSFLVQSSRATSFLFQTANEVEITSYDPFIVLV
jgi:hypothetical protein